jgi:hypothetical protein
MIERTARQFQSMQAGIPARDIRGFPSPFSEAGLVFFSFR